MRLHDSVQCAFGETVVDLSDYMVEDGTYLSERAEADRTIDTGNLSFRPCIEAQGLRLRLRDGVTYALGPTDVFFGTTYRSQEFTEQEEGQLVGSIALFLYF